jgi:hypothetical protein
MHSRISKLFYANRFVGCICLLFVFSHSLNAQTFKVSLSPKHQSKVSKGKTVAQRLKTYRKLYSKDSARQIRKLDKMYQKKSDSLFKANRREERLCNLARMKGLPCRKDTLNALSGLLKRDSARSDSLTEKGELYARDELSDQLPADQSAKLKELETKYGKQSSQVNKYLAVLSDSVSKVDTLKSAMLSEGGKLASAFAEDKIKDMDAMKSFSEHDKALNDIKSTPDQYKNQAEKYQDTENIKSEAKDQAQAKATEAAVEKFTENMALVKPVQEKMSLLKNKYSSILNSGDMSTATKAKSLEGRPLRERLIIGGNFNIPSTSPLMFDLTPQLGYRIDKTFQIGVGGLYRAMFTDSVKAVNAPPASVYGYSVFVNHELIWKFFAYGEWERANREATANAADVKRRVWVDNLNIGLGRRFAIHKKINASLLFLWNPLHENGKGTQADAFVIKTGFHLSELALFKN